MALLRDDKLALGILYLRANTLRTLAHSKTLNPLKVFMGKERAYTSLKKKKIVSLKYVTNFEIFLSSLNNNNFYSFTYN